MYPFRREIPASGQWVLYHRTFADGRLQLLQSRLTITRGFLGGTRVDVVETIGSQTEAYSGVVGVETPHLLIQLKGALPDSECECSAVQ
jgi:hypothetical protein